jgi:acetamidase/formamidase
MRDCFRKARRFLMTLRNLTEDEAISLLSVGVDFGVSQVANGNWGVHAVIRKALLQVERGGNGRHGHPFPHRDYPA